MYSYLFATLNPSFTCPYPVTAACSIPYSFAICAVLLALKKVQTIISSEKERWFKTPSRKYVMRRKIQAKAQSTGERGPSHIEVTGGSPESLKGIPLKGTRIRFVGVSRIHFQPA